MEVLRDYTNRKRIKMFLVLEENSKNRGRQRRERTRGHV